MASPTRRVVFARINRRQPLQATLANRAFAEDLRDLAASHLTRFEQRGTSGRIARTWFAADMNIDVSGDFITGTLGFATQEERRSFDDQSWSWVKGETQVSEAASQETVSPFAVDMRESNRWVAFAPAARLQAPSFLSGLENVLNQAVIDLRLIPTEWEVDLVVSRSTVNDWLLAHPLVHLLRRTIKFSNPGRDLDNDRAEMRALGAGRKTEEFKAPRLGALDVNSAEFVEKLDGTETGDLDLHMEARGAQGVSDARFDSQQDVDRSYVDDFGSDLARGIELVLSALREYVLAKSTAGPSPSRTRE